MCDTNAPPLQRRQADGELVGGEESRQRRHQTSWRRRLLLLWARALGVTRVSFAASRRSGERRSLAAFVPLAEAGAALRNCRVTAPTGGCCRSRAAPRRRRLFLRAALASRKGDGQLSPQSVCSAAGAAKRHTYRQLACETHFHLCSICCLRHANLALRIRVCVFELKRLLFVRFVFRQ